MGFDIRGELEGLEAGLRDLEAEAMREQVVPVDVVEVEEPARIPIPEYIGQPIKLKRSFLSRLPRIPGFLIAPAIIMTLVVGIKGVQKVMEWTDEEDAKDPRQIVTERLLEKRIPRGDVDYSKYSLRHSKVRAIIKQLEKAEEERKAEERALMAKVVSESPMLQAFEGVLGVKIGVYSGENDPPERDLRIGSPAVKIAPYSEVEGVSTAEEYWTFLRETVVEPEETSEIIDHRIILPKENLTITSSPIDTYERGDGDCDDYSEICRQTLDHLGRSIGVDLDPRLISAIPEGEDVGHALCIYTVNGQQFAIDQSPPVAFDVLGEASSYFAQDDLVYQEAAFDDAGNLVRWSIDPELNETNEMMTVFVLDPEADYDEDPSAVSEILPEGWEAYKKASVFMNFGAEDMKVVEYAEGVEQGVFGITLELP